MSFFSQFHSFQFATPGFAEFLDGYDYLLDGRRVRVEFRNQRVIGALRAFMENFGERVMLFDFSWLKRNSLAVLQGIERHLGLNPCFAPDNYDDLRINASDRWNVRPLSHLLHQEWIVSLVGALLPRRAAIRMRGAFDRASARSASAVRRPASRAYSDADVELARSMLADQSREVARLFSSGPAILGDGRPFPLD